MFGTVNTFWREESGAVTVDWVVMTAAVVGLGLATTVVVSGGVENLSMGVDEQLRSDHISDSFETAMAGVWGDLDLLNSGGFTQEDYEGAVDSWVQFSGSHQAAYDDVVGTVQSASSPAVQADYIDMAGAIEADMIAQGIEPSSDSPSYSELHADWMAEHG